MAEQLLRDPGQNPTPERIAEGLGKANAVYLQFLEGLKEYDISLMDWRYYNDGKAWLSKGEYKWVTKRGTQKVKPLFWLSIWEGFFKISFFFSAKIQEELLALPLSEEAGQIVANAKAMGKTAKFMPVIFDVDRQTQLEDVYLLTQFRKESI